MVTRKARSRLRRVNAVSPLIGDAAQQPAADTSFAGFHGHTKHFFASIALPNVKLTSLPINWLKLQHFIQRWPQLAISLSVFFALWRLISAYSPNQLAHWLFPNSYLPVMGLWLIAWWYLGSFWLQSSRRGLIGAIYAYFWLYSRLQLVITVWWWWLVALIVWLVLEMVGAKIAARRV